MGDPTYLKALKRYAKNEPTVDDLSDMEKEFYGESDRAVVILQASMVENALEIALRKVLKQEVPGLFDYDGPMGTLANRIKVGYALGIFGATTRGDLNLIRELRNQFAHCRNPLSFDMPVVADVCSHLQIPNVAGVSITPMGLVDVTGDERLATDLKNPKTRYICACFSITVQLVQFSRSDASSPFDGAMLP